MAPQAEEREEMITHCEPRHQMSCHSHFSIYPISFLFVFSLWTARVALLPTCTRKFPHKHTCYIHRRFFSPEIKKEFPP